MSELPVGFYSKNPSGGDDSGLLAAVTAAGDRRLLLGAGTFQRSAGTWQLSQNGTAVNGIERSATKVRHDVSGDVAALLVKNVRACSVEDMTITASAARTQGKGIHVVGGDTAVPLDGVSYAKLIENAVRIKNVDMDNQFYGIVIEPDTNRYPWRVYIDGGLHRNAAVNGCGIHINAVTPGSPPDFGASHFIENWYFGQAPADTLAAIRLTGTGDATLTNNEAYGAQYSLLMDPPANGFLTSVTVNGGFYDRAKLACLRIAPDAAVARFGAITFNGTWFAGCSLGDVAQIVGSGAKYIKFMGCTFYSAEAVGKWCAVVDGASYVDFIGCTFAGGRGGGLKFTGGASNFRVIGCSFHPTLVGTGFNGLPIAVQIDDTCDEYVVAFGNDWSDAAITSKVVNQLGNPITPTATKIIEKNIG